MATTHGMDPREVRALGHDLQAKAEEIRRKAQWLDRMVHNAYWTGPEAVRFKYSWWPAHRAKMWSVAEGLEGFGQSALNNASEQSSVSAADRSGAGRASSMGSGPSISPAAVDQFLHLVGDVVGLPRTITDLRRLTMLGLTDIGLATSDVGSDAWMYFRGAKGGYTAALNRLEIPYVEMAVAGGTVLVYGTTTGWGSTETATATVEGVLEVGAGFVPGGGIALAVGEAGGDFLYHRTPLGDYLEDQFLDEDYARHDYLHSQIDEAMASGDFERADALVDESRRLSEDINRQSTGWTGLWNATKNTLLDSWAEPIRERIF